MNQWQLKKRKVPDTTKGYQSESCADAIQTVLKKGEVVTFTDLFNRIKQKGAWKDETIWQHLMSRVVNLPPARKHWKNSTPFLFLHTDGRYELYNPDKHPPVID